MSMPHICTVCEQTDYGFPLLPKDAPLCKKVRRQFAKWCLPAEDNPKCVEFFRGTTGLQNERERQIKHNWTNVIHPFSKIKSFHEYVMVVTFFLTFITSPIVSSLEYHVRRRVVPDLYLVTLPLCAIYWVDFIVRLFFLAYMRRVDKEIVLERKRIFLSYVTSVYFFCDITVLYPIDLIEKLGYHNKILEYVALLKLIRGITFFQYLTCISERLRLSVVTHYTIKYVITTYVLTHWVACITLVASDAEDPNSWLSKYGILDKCFAELYILMLHRGAGYFCCAYFQGNSTTLRSEKLTAGFLFILGKIYLTVLAIVILHLTSTTRSLETKYHAIIDQLNEYMKMKKFPLPMRERLLCYYENKFHKRFFTEKAIDNILSEKLKKEINIHVCRQLIANVAFFSELPTRLVRDIMSHLKSEIYLPHDIIIKAGSVGDAMYFIGYGTVAVTTPSGKEVCHLEDGDYFGEVPLLLNERKNIVNVVALEISEVFKLEKKLFRICFKDEHDVLLEKMTTEARFKLQKVLGLEEQFQQEIFMKTYVA